YCNDNLIYSGQSSDRQFITFSYDRIRGCFRLANGWCNTDPNGQFMSPVYKTVSMDGSEFIRLGMSVEKNRIRCFYNDELIFDYKSSAERIANYVGSPLLMWNEGNITRISNITIAENGYLFPENGTHTDGFVVGSDGLLLNYYGNDTEAVIPDNVKKIGTFAFAKKTDMKTIIFPDSVKEIEQNAFARCRSLTIRDYGTTLASEYCENNNISYRRIYNGDVDDNGFVNASDVIILGRKLCGADLDVSIGADFNRDGKVNNSDIVAIRRWLAS
ncbi:MAG: leucine-rich repeat protein, partial [Clostridia bacterium]|nr:leucine-rich repeat protein [Clostridia bacterium]